MYILPLTLSLVGLLQYTLATTTTCSPAGLNAAAKAAGKIYFGTATETYEQQDSGYCPVSNSNANFGQLTPTNAMKWDATEPSQNTFTFAAAEQIASLAKSNNQILRCHTLVWYEALPTWVSSGNWNKAQLTQIMTNHITNVVKQFKGRCYAWDVVNEAILDDGTYRPNVFYNTIGESYISLAYKAAAAADPGAKLYYNDFNLENRVNNTVKIAAVGAMVDMIRASGGKIDGIGLQSHLESDILVIATSTMADAMNYFVKKNMDVAITELDVRIPVPTTPNSIARQAQQYKNAVTACYWVSRCVGVTVWDFTDKYSWVPYVFPTMGSAHIWDKNLVKKEGVYDAVIAGWGSTNYCKRSEKRNMREALRRGVEVVERGIEVIEERGIEVLGGLI